MNETIAVNAQDFTLVHIAKDGSRYVKTHRVWNRDLFLESQLNAAVKEGGSIEVYIPAEAE